MQFAGLNHWAVVAATIVSFLFGALWYGALSNPWLRALGKTRAEIGERARPLWMLLLTSLVAEFVMAWVLAGLIGHLGPGQVTLRNGVISAAFVWLGFVLTTLVVNHGYQGSRPSLTAIDGAHWLGVLLLQGAVIGALGT
jgi:uncharacterized protein DUF1761